MDATKILAKVGDVAITEADVDATISALGPRGQGYNNPEGRSAVLEQLIAKQLFLFDAKKNAYEDDPKFKEDLAKVREEMLANFAIEKEISAITVSDDELKKFYEDHKNEFVSYPVFEKLSQDYVDSVILSGEDYAKKQATIQQDNLALRKEVEELRKFKAQHEKVIVL